MPPHPQVQMGSAALSNMLLQYAMYPQLNQLQQMQAAKQHQVSVQS